MKKRCLLIALVLITFSIPTFAQRPVRVAFKRGATSTVLTGRLNGYKGSRVFLLRVREGQTLKVKAIKGSVSIWIQVPPGSVEQDLAADCHSRSEISPTARGDYKLTIQECQKTDPWKGIFKVRLSVK